MNNEDDILKAVNLKTTKKRILILSVLNRSNIPLTSEDILEKASKDAKARAASMLKPTHNSVGKIQSVRMGVYQITPVDSTNVSDMGINDTSSIDKKVTAVANVSFKIK